ncbi:VOC family protein [Microbacterium sp. zg.Y625]|uniref:VOC family protein n=1 Tax=Microbacterium jiangjiandongii TaxID=3049071 RepID=UPI00214C2E66|nr:MULTISPECIES: VOC family protein [unclassified Microbacterium]MCR2792504.1 VOC family protein [Microbacterium sp. zg.Y625]WIM26495.1 VOC family protein [Microbacterium sp. zg-Y625]
MSTATDDRVLHPHAAMGAVSLRVADLEAMSGYYTHAFAMEPLVESVRGREVHRVLGRGSTPLVRLVHTPDLPQAGPREAGLFHTAFLFDDAEALAATVYRAAQHPRSRFTGSADHLVSEAFYFTDPEGNGVELYTDRDRAEWVHVAGQIQMDVLALDPNEYLRRHLTQEALDAGPSRAGAVGHVHLQVGDIATARAFYVDALGFEATQSAYPGALFAAAGGYHHHIAMNTWNSRGAGPRAAALGLGDVSITVPHREELDALTARLRGHGIAHDGDGRSVRAVDPWGTQVTVALPDPSPDEVLQR